MRYREEERAPSKAPQQLLALNDDELALVTTLVRNALQTGGHAAGSADRHRLENMSRALTMAWRTVEARGSSPAAEGADAKMEDEMKTTASRVEGAPQAPANLAGAICEVYAALDDLRSWLGHIHQVTGGPHRKEFPYGAGSGAAGGRDADLLKALGLEAEKPRGADWTVDGKLRTWEYEAARGAAPPLAALLDGYRASKRRLVELLRREVRLAEPVSP